jgi:hypothetical protein
MSMQDDQSRPDCQWEEVYAQAITSKRAIDPLLEFRR